MSRALVIDRRFAGFTEYTQGGYLAGVLAGELGLACVDVKLRSPAEHERPLTLEVEGGRASLRNAGTLVAEAVGSQLELEIPEPVTVPEAEAASREFRGFSRHPYPRCFCCGHERAEGDGLRIFPGRARDGTILAAPWTPAAELAGEDGTVRPEVVWAAFDCPQLWALLVLDPDVRARFENGPPTLGLLTGQMVTEIRAPVLPERAHAIASWPLGADGRKRFAGAALWSAEGELLAAGRQTAFIAG